MFSTPCSSCRFWGELSTTVTSGALLYELILTVPCRAATGTNQHALSLAEYKQALSSQQSVPLQAGSLHQQGWCWQAWSGMLHLCSLAAGQM